MLNFYSFIFIFSKNNKIFEYFPKTFFLGIWPQSYLCVLFYVQKNTNNKILIKFKYTKFNFYLCSSQSQVQYNLTKSATHPHTSVAWKLAARPIKIPNWIHMLTRLRLIVDNFQSSAKAECRRSANNTNNCESNWQLNTYCKWFCISKYVCLASASISWHSHHHHHQQQRQSKQQQQQTSSCLALPTSGWSVIFGTKYFHY